ncbi:threonine/serine exporter family protein [Staphylococcus sp. NRL 16/872]|uniref:threonine/serine exporter family protein n=1 Tax=Staphylococcus sp. NRL 16/872 TaxID=2930131 RepID=UPI001FB35EED|nr:MULTISPECIES: threonine/serine exporter family protein [unclassified Staphylococcus]MCJ1657052.1 threonine/serine exporter family protein [Staphylococcus sp. NRL 21/187]MCJ1662803.1 threonine/serine exporter family protein [Staphylococcus sp. NRL 18/288]MCJ1668911.1 threonine/serine exporter family protein [Staphylococcus sp. NRL 19/737]WEN69130.1 threonine/serine exporter family protein [Staphylococcus sp. NRL 16/872]
MFWLLNLLFSYTASLFFCVIFDAPRRLYLSCGFVGAFGWMVYILFFQGLNIHTIYSSFFGSFALGLISHYMARKKREPAIIFMVPGIIPLVPGGLAFDATKNLVLLEFGRAINTMLEVTLIAGAIALGLLFADQISKIVASGFVRRRKRI